MFMTRLMVSLFEFALSVVMSGLLIFVTFKVFIKANPDFNMEAEIKKGNVAVGILVTAILFSASMILKEGLASVVSMVRMHLSMPTERVLSLAQLIALSAAHLVMAMFMALFTISVTLRLFGKLERPGMRPGKELENGNVAVGILLAGVVLVASLYVGAGVSAVSKALVPQPSIGQVQVME
ncbi:MAG TPA: DUF350 domain-containing protein [Elusimicrobiales bacterium]|nr:DUF350 domain-containing protein [Elusimicrobiales bacterium]